MNAETRSSLWQIVEGAFADDKVPLGTPFPIGMMIALRREDAIPQVRNELARAGLEVASVDKNWWPFGRRWEIAVKSQDPRPIDRVEVDALLDTLERALAKHDAVVVTWAPLRPGA
jgi:hypothetical protein